MDKHTPIHQVDQIIIPNPKIKPLETTAPIAMDALQKSQAANSNAKQPESKTTSPVSMDLLAKDNKAPVASNASFFSKVGSLFSSNAPEKKQESVPPASIVCQAQSMAMQEDKKEIAPVVAADTYNFNLPRYQKLPDTVQEQFEDMNGKKKFSALLSEDARDALDSVDDAARIICCLSQTIPDCPVRCRGFLFDLETLLDLLEKGNGVARFPMGNDDKKTFTYAHICPAEDVVRDIRDRIDAYKRAPGPRT